MKKKINGQITLETAIIMPIIMLIIVSLIYLVMYTHDAVVIKAYTYGAASAYVNEDFDRFKGKVIERVANAPLFVINPQLEFEKELDSYKIIIQGSNNSKLHFMEQLINESYHPEDIEIEKNMSSEIVYISQTILKQLKRKKK